MTKNTQKCSVETRSKLTRGHTHFLFIRRTVLIWYGVSCILIVEINNFFWEVSDSEQVIRWQTKTVLGPSIISRK